MITYFVTLLFVGIGCFGLGFGVANLINSRPRVFIVRRNRRSF